MKHRLLIAIQPTKPTRASQSKNIKRIHKKLTDEEKVRYKELAAKTDLDDRQQVCEAARQIEDGYRHLREAMQLLVSEREKQNISLSELARRVGIDKGNLARLESGSVPNPTIGTIQRIAEALGKDVQITLCEKPAD